MAHRHRIKSTTTHGYSAPISGAKYEPRAHGGVCHADRCACGATRRTNSNGPYEERGKWVALPSRSADADLPLVAGQGLAWVEGPFRRARMVAEGERARTPDGSVVAYRRGQWIWEMRI